MPWLHHTLVHFPIALALVAAALSAWSRARPAGHWRQAARTLTYLAAAGALLAGATGLLSAAHVIEMGGDPHRVALHRNVALAGISILVASSVATWWSERRASSGITATVLLAVAAVTLAAAADFGGDMLHPGLAPWSKEPHHHGPSEEPHDHVPSDKSAEAPTPSASAAPSASASIREMPDLPAPDASARHEHTHGGHEHKHAH